MPSLFKVLKIVACTLFASAGLAACSDGQVEHPGLSLEPHARMTHVHLNEVSGMVKSPSREDVYWVLNDSGDEARLFTIHADGTSVLPTYSRFTRWADEEAPDKEAWEGFSVLYAQNVDWEDMSADEDYLYIADTGNNDNSRQDLVIYAVGEIDPTASTRAAAVRQFPVKYPDQQAFPPADRHFDSESLFVSDGSLYLITKHRGSGVLRHPFEPGAKLYRLDTDYTDQVNELVLVEETALIEGATSAELSPAGEKLAVLSFEVLWLFDRPVSGDHWLSSSYRRILLNPSSFRQAETVVWEDEDTLLITNEQRDMFRLSLSQVP